MLATVKTTTTRTMADTMMILQQLRQVNQASNHLNGINPSRVCFFCADPKLATEHNLGHKWIYVCASCEKAKYHEKFKYVVSDSWQKLTGLCWRCLKSLPESPCPACGSGSFDRCPHCGKKINGMR